MDSGEENGMEMSHDDIDEDIKLLKTVLQDGEDNDDCESEGELQIIEQNDDEYVSLHSASRPSTSTDFTVSSFPTTSMGTDADDLVYRIEHSSITPETCLAMNRAYQEVLLDTLRNIELSLTENRLKQRQMTDILDQKCKKSLNSQSHKTYGFSLRSPFFIDKGQIPPPNADMMQKKQMGDPMSRIKSRCMWSKRVRMGLLKAIGDDALKQAMRPILNKLEIESSKLKDCKNDEEIKAVSGKIAELKKELQLKQETPADELLKHTDTDKIDFLKISVVNFDGKIGATECESFWRNVLHPSINREHWTEDEEDQLEQLVKKYNMKHWAKIAAELNTNRTPFQCLQHYQLNSVAYDLSEWRPEEDELLVEVVDTVKYGTGKIQWSQVAYYIENRGPSQCMHRWRKINPNSKKGKWSNMEDCLLISAVEKYGIVDWSRITHCVPGRSGTQCRDRYLNVICAARNVWDYQEDKKLLKLYHQHQSFATVALYMDMRTDVEIERRYLQLKDWEEKWNTFCTLNREEQEAQLSCNFKLTKDGTLVAWEYLKVWADQEKALGKPEEEIDAEYEEISRYFDDHEVLRGMERENWKVMENKCQIKTDDFFRQEQDRIQNDIIVPRPPPIRNREVYTRYLYDKNRIKDMIKLQVDNAVNNLHLIKNSANKPLIDKMSSTFNELFQEDEKEKYIEEKTVELIKKGGRRLLNRQVTVRTLLNLLKGDEGCLPREEVTNVKKKQKPKIKKEEWEESSDEDTMSLKSDDGEEEGEDDDEEEEEEDFIEEEITKPKREFSEAELHRFRRLQAARQEHKEALDMVRQAIIGQLPLQSTGGRKRGFTMYPQHIKDKIRPLCEEDLELEKHKCLSLLMRSFDVNMKTVFKNASEAKRKHAARALLMSAKPAGRTRRSKYRSQQGVDSEETENADTLLEIQDTVGGGEEEDEGVEDVKPNMELFTTYDQCLPFIPPNVNTIQALKAFLLQHKPFVDRAQEYFDRDALRDKLYKMKKRGPNLLMNVIGAARGMSSKSLKISKKKWHDAEDMRKTKQVIYTTKPYQQLKARFQAAFSWPALLATVSTPSHGTVMPSSIMEIRKSACENQQDSSQQQQENQYQNPARPKPLNQRPKPLNQPVKQEEPNKTIPKCEVDDSMDGCETEASMEESREEDWNIDESIKHVILMMEGQIISEQMEEIEINMLVDKILHVFRERKTNKKKSKSVPGKYRKKMSDAMLAAVDLREKIKIMKRLNIYEKYKEIQEKKEKPVKKEVPGPVDPNAPRKRGRPFGAKSMCYSEPNENTRRSSRQETLREKAQQMEVYEECGASPTKKKYPTPKRFKEEFVYTRDEFKTCQKIAEKNRRAMETSRERAMEVNRERAIEINRESKKLIYIKQEMTDTADQPGGKRKRSVSWQDDGNTVNGTGDNVGTASIAKQPRTQTISTVNETGDNVGTASIAKQSRTETASTVNKTGDNVGTSSLAKQPRTQTISTVNETGDNVGTASLAKQPRTQTASAVNKTGDNVGAASLAKQPRTQTASTGTCTVVNKVDQPGHVQKEKNTGFKLVQIVSKTSKSRYKLVPIEDIDPVTGLMKSKKKAKTKTKDKKDGSVNKKKSKVTVNGPAVSDEVKEKLKQRKIKKTVSESKNEIIKNGKTESATSTSTQAVCNGENESTQQHGTQGKSTQQHGTQGKSTQQHGTQGKSTQQHGTQGKSTQQHGTQGKSTQQHGTQGKSTQQHGTQGKSTQQHGTQGKSTQQHGTQGKSTQQHGTQGKSTQQHGTQGKSTQQHGTQGKSTQQHGTQGKSTQQHGTQGKSTQQHGTQGKSTQQHSTQGKSTQQHGTQGKSTQQHGTQGKSTQQHGTQGKSTQQHGTQGKPSQRKTVTLVTYPPQPGSIQDLTGTKLTESSIQSPTSQTSTVPASSYVSISSLSTEVRNNTSNGEQVGSSNDTVTQSSKSCLKSKILSQTSTSNKQSNASTQYSDAGNQATQIHHNGLDTKAGNQTKLSSVGSPKSSSNTDNMAASKSVSGQSGNSIDTKCTVTGNQSATGSGSDQSKPRDPVMIGVPIMMDGVEKTAWLPILTGTDGKIQTDKDGNIVIPKEIATIRYPQDEEK